MVFEGGHHNNDLNNNLHFIQERRYKIVYNDYINNARALYWSNVMNAKNLIAEERPPLQHNKKGRLLLNLRAENSSDGITAETLEKLAKMLGFNSKGKKTQVVHYALVKLAKEMLPRYEEDDGELNAQQLKAIHNAVPQDGFKSVESSLF